MASKDVVEEMKGADEKLKEQSLEEMVALMAAENEVLLRKLDNEQANNSALRSRLSVSFKCLKILHAQRPLEDDKSNMTIVTDKLIEQLEALNQLERILNDRTHASEENARKISLELTTLKLEHTRILEISQQVKNAYEVHIQNAHAKAAELYERCRAVEEELEAERERASMLAFDLKGTTQRLRSVQAEKEIEAQSASEQRHQLEEALSRARSDGAASVRALEHERLLHARARAQGAERAANLKRLMAHARALEADAGSRARAHERLEEECLALRMELDQALAAREEQRQVVELLDRQCAAYEAELARSQRRHAPSGPRPLARAQRKLARSTPPVHIAGDLATAAGARSGPLGSDTGSVAGAGRQVQNFAETGSGGPTTGAGASFKLGAVLHTASPPSTSQLRHGTASPNPRTAGRAAVAACAADRRPLQALDRNAWRVAAEQRPSQPRLCNQAPAGQRVTDHGAAAGCSSPCRPPSPGEVGRGAATRTDGGGAEGSVRKVSRALAAGMVTAVRAHANRVRCGGPASNEDLELISE